MHTRGRTARAGALLIGAALLVLVTDVWLGPLQLPPYHLRLAGLAYMALAFLSLPVVYGRVLPRVWQLSVALALLGLPVSVVRPASVGEGLPWLGVGLVFALVVLAWPRGREPADAAGLMPFRTASLVVCFVAGLVVAGFQLFNKHLLSQGVPNEERSLFLGGIEIHHLVWGVLLVAAVGTWGHRLRWGGAGRWVLPVLLGVGLGLLIDQWLYFARIDPSDEAYFEAPAVISAWAGLGVLYVSWRLVWNRA